MLRKSELPIDHDVEDAILALDQLRIDTEILGNCGRQTGSLMKIVSRDAVSDRDLHRKLLFYFFSLQLGTVPYL